MGFWSQKACTFELFIPLAGTNLKPVGRGLVSGLHFIREIIQIARKLLHLLYDAIQRPAKRATLPIQMYLFVSCRFLYKKNMSQKVYYKVLDKSLDVN